MKHTLGYIDGKKSDFKVCSKCGTINWHENLECINCNNDIFTNSEKRLQDEINSMVNQLSDEGFDWCYIYDSYTILT